MKVQEMPQYVPCPQEVAPSMESLQERIYLQLRSELLSGIYRPGVKLKIRTLAAYYGVSAMPIRAALLRLISDGALEAAQQRSVKVPLLNEAKYAEVLGVRLLMEGRAAELAATRVSTAEIAQLAEFTEHMNTALKIGDVSGYLHNNSQFHLTLYRCSANASLLRLIETLWLQTAPLFHFFFHSPNVTLPLNDFHLDVLEALEKRDSFKVRAAIEADLKYFGEFLLTHLHRLSVNAH